MDNNECFNWWKKILNYRRENIKLGMFPILYVGVDIVESIDCYDSKPC